MTERTHGPIILKQAIDSGRSRGFDPSQSKVFLDLRSETYIPLDLDPRSAVAALMLPRLALEGRQPLVIDSEESRIESNKPSHGQADKLRAGMFMRKDEALAVLRANPILVVLFEPTTPQVGTDRRSYNKGEKGIAILNGHTRVLEAGPVKLHRHLTAEELQNPKSITDGTVTVQSGVDGNKKARVDINLPGLDEIPCLVFTSAQLAQFVSSSGLAMTEQAVDEILTEQVNETAASYSMKQGKLPKRVGVSSLEELVGKFKSFEFTLS